MQSDGSDISRTCHTEKVPIVASVSSSPAQRTSLMKHNDKEKSQGKDKEKEKKVVAGDKAGDKVGDKRKQQNQPMNSGERAPLAQMQKGLDVLYVDRDGGGGGNEGCSERVQDHDVEWSEKFVPAGMRVLWDVRPTISGKLQGRHIMHKWLVPHGWYSGKILKPITKGVSCAKGFNFMVGYRKKSTNDTLHGDYAQTIYPGEYGVRGVGKWVLLTSCAVACEGCECCQKAHISQGDPHRQRDPHHQRESGDKERREGEGSGVQSKGGDKKEGGVSAGKASREKRRKLQAKASFDDAEKTGSGRWKAVETGEERERRPRITGKVMEGRRGWGDALSGELSSSSRSSVRNMSDEKEAEEDGAGGMLLQCGPDFERWGRSVCENLIKGSENAGEGDIVLACHGYGCLCDGKGAEKERETYNSVRLVQVISISSIYTTHIFHICTS